MIKGTHAKGVRGFIPEAAADRRQSRRATRVKTKTTRNPPFGPPPAGQLDLPLVIGTKKRIALRPCASLHQHGTQEETPMLMELSDKAKDLRERLQAFMEK